MNYLLVKWIAYETWEINVKQGTSRPSSAVDLI